MGPSVSVLGEDTRKHGLKLSLFERLHIMYAETEYAQTHNITLLTNYNCHHAILSLSSYLFYESALLTNAKGSTLSSGLHFICSSLNKDEHEVRDNLNKLEADILIEAVIDHLEHYSLNICIIASSSTQVIIVISFT